MQEMDLSIDEAKAKIWMQDVNSELSAVRSILNKVNGALAEVPNDTIMEGIYKVGVAMGNAWGEMCNIFDEVQDKVSSSVSKLGETISNVVEEVEAVRAKIAR